MRSRADPPRPSTETTVAAGEASDTTAAQTKLRRINPIRVDCSSTAEGFSCDSLIARRSEQGWNNDPNSDEPIEFVFTFAPEVALEQVVLKNATDEERYTRNLKVQGFVIETDDMGGAVETNVIPEASGPHVINVATVGTTELTFRVTSTYPSEALDANRGALRHPAHHGLRVLRQAGRRVSRLNEHAVASPEAPRDSTGRRCRFGEPRSRGASGPPPGPGETVTGGSFPRSGGGKGPTRRWRREGPVPMSG